MANASPGALVALGIVVGLISTCVQSVGLTLQRKSHMLEDEKEDHLPRRPPYRRRQWQIGMFLFLIANIIGSSIQITTLPLPLLSTLQASGLVFNSLLASLLLKEPWTRRTGFCASRAESQSWAIIGAVTPTGILGLVHTILGVRAGSTGYGLHATKMHIFEPPGQRADTLD